MSSFGVSGIMSALRAEELMKDSQLFGQIERLRANIAYETKEGRLGFDDYFKTLTSEIDSIPKLTLEDDVAPGTETTYTIQLTQEVERIVDECDRLFRRLNQFEGKLKEAERQVLNQKAEFVAWYMLAAGLILKDLDSKLPQAKLANLAEAEFSRLIGGLDVVLTSLIDAVEIENSRVSQHKTTQKEKYNLGKDQANASWTSSLPAFGGAITEDRGDVSGVQEMDDDVPAPIKAQPQIKISDTLRIMRPADDVPCICTEIPPNNPACRVHFKEIKGTFAKTGDPQPATIISVPKSARQKLIEEDEI